MAKNGNIWQLSGIILKINKTLCLVNMKEQLFTVLNLLYYFSNKIMNMKSIIICSLTMLVGGASAQISTPVKEIPSTIIGKVNPMNTFIAELNYSVKDKDTTYTLSFRDMKYEQITSIKSIQFSGEGNTVEQLYSLMKSVFLDENKKNKDYAVTVTLGSNLVSISHYRNMVQFLVDNSNVFLTEKQIDKLFGKS